MEQSRGVDLTVPRVDLTVMGPSHVQGKLGLALIELSKVSQNGQGAGPGPIGIDDLRLNATLYPIPHGHESIVRD